MRAPAIQLPHPPHAAVRLPPSAIPAPSAKGPARSTFREALGLPSAGHPGGRHAGAGPTTPPEERRRTVRDHGLEATDPLARQTAQLGPPAVSGPPPPPAGPSASAVVSPRASLEDLLPALVRKVAWSGDGRRGAVRLELGSGPLAGATLLVQTDEGRVRVDLCAPDGADLGGWRARIAQRLAARGLDVEHVEVT